MDPPSRDSNTRAPPATRAPPDAVSVSFSPGAPANARVRNWSRGTAEAIAGRNRALRAGACRIGFAATFQTKAWPGPKTTRTGVLDRPRHPCRVVLWRKKTCNGGRDRLRDFPVSSPFLHIRRNGEAPRGPTTYHCRRAQLPRALARSRRRLEQGATAASAFCPPARSSRRARRSSPRPSSWPSSPCSRGGEVPAGGAVGLARPARSADVARSTGASSSAPPRARRRPAPRPHRRLTAPARRRSYSHAQAPAAIDRPAGVDWGQASRGEGEREHRAPRSTAARCCSRRASPPRRRVLRGGSAPPPRPPLSTSPPRLLGSPPLEARPSTPPRPPGSGAGTAKEKVQGAWEPAGWRAAAPAMASDEERAGAGGPHPSAWIRRRGRGRPRACSSPSSAAPALRRGCRRPRADATRRLQREGEDRGSGAGKNGGGWGGTMGGCILVLTCGPLLVVSMEESYKGRWMRKNEI
jgi:hypothetical protein